MNVELLRATAGKILSDPEHWNQSYWARVDSLTDLEGLDQVEYTREGRISTFTATPVPACGTARCFAGWALHLGDPKMTMLMGTGGARGEAELAMLSTGEVVDIEHHARGVLDLTWDESRALFHGSNTLGDIMSYLTDWGVFGGTHNYEGDADE